MTGKIFIVAPANLATGGPELCHQLADTLNKDSKRAFIVYYPFTQRHETPAPYRRYNTYLADVEDIEPGSTVVLPEVYGHLVAEFPGSQIYFWWMSTGNFYAIAGEHAETQLDTMRRHVTKHLYQSEHARAFLERVSLGPAHRLSDYLSDAYLQTKPPSGPRENILVYNPAKGWNRTLLILQALRRRLSEMPQIVPVKDMTPEQVRDLLSRAKVYIDFGGHPGKDRLPREAAACGACVLTNRRGSAANSVDVPIPREFKIDDRKSGFEQRAANKIHMLMSNFEQQSARFDEYRQMIGQESAVFQDDVDSVFTTERLNIA